MAKCKHFAATLALLVFSVHLFGIRDCCAKVFAVHLGDVIHGETLRAGGLAFVKVRAVAEAFLVHLGDHGQDALLRLDLALGQEAEVRDLGGYEQHSGCVLTGGHAGTATNTGGSVEGAVGIGLGNRDRGSFRSDTGVHKNEAIGIKMLF